MRIPLHLRLACLFVVAMAACQSDLDCRLLGVCREGSCQCDPGWSGSDCGTAKLMPFENAGYINASGYSWGGNAIQAPDGRWHLFFSELSHECPLALFRNVSMISHAMSESLTGNFTLVERIRAPFAHNAAPVQLPGGGIVIYGEILIEGSFLSVKGVPHSRERPFSPIFGCSLGIGTPNAGHAASCYDHSIPPCFHSVQNNSCSDHQPMDIIALYAPSVEGPWTFQVIQFTGTPAISGSSNPTVVFHTNGSAVMVYRGQSDGGESLSMAVSDSWRGPFRYENITLVSPKDKSGSHEDPHLFIDKRGHYHVISHNQGTDRLCPLTNECGAHLYSSDGKAWHIQRSTVYVLDMSAYPCTH